VAGVSNKCAASAVYETAYSRVAMSFISLALPTALVIMGSSVGINPKGKIGSFAY